MHIKDLKKGDVLRYRVAGPVFRYWRLLEKPNEGTPLSPFSNSTRRVNATTALFQDGALLPGTEIEENGWCALSLDQEADLVPPDQIPDDLP